MKGLFFIASLVLVTSSGLAQTNHIQNERLFAAVQIHTMHKAILGFESSCQKWGSAAMVDITKEKSVWEQKHAAILAAADQVLATGTPQQRAQLDAGIDAQNLEMEQKLESAPEEERARWCADFPKRIASENMNLGNSPAYQRLMN